ncbi:E3 ubiquitin-protein ligase MARCHF5-like [Xenia sp. Carnegie-2017]|uniref:E3 ubiquitin-protein ligase MARCHF5-like n=1 Tax=Xenia sp. Carnegie-2017 TaxID=2897299 RepID=UPI001F0386AD|nr:E3 ubiquitin-protein ligase MARCHF5-like [Xenia sp. Carnegie-2017]
MSISSYDITAQFSPSDRRCCWVCFMSEDDDPRAEWTHPCRCRGTGRWVHQTCLQRWIDEKQGGNSSVQVYCPQCNTEYLIDYPPMNIVLTLIENVDGIINRLSPVATAGLLVGSIYWSAVTFGAVTIFQVLGQKTGLRVIEESDPMVLFIGLPTIPLTLILAKMIRWQDYVLRGWRHLSPGLAFYKYLFPEESHEEQAPLREPNEDSLVDAASATRIICGALSFPTTALFCGNLLFPSSTRIKRIFLGGLFFVLTKGFIKMYYKQQQYTRQASRKIRDYPDMY